MLSLGQNLEIHWYIPPPLVQTQWQLPFFYYGNKTMTSTLWELNYWSGTLLDSIWLGDTEMLESWFWHLSRGETLREGNGTPLQYSCLENPRDGGARWAAIHGVAQSRTRLKWLSSSSGNTLCILLLWHSSCCTNNWFLMFCLWIMDFLRARAGSCSSLNL